MRGDQFARQWRIIRGIEASPEGLTVAQIGLSPYPFKFKTLPLSRKGAKAAAKNILNLNIPCMVSNKTSRFKKMYEESLRQKEQNDTASIEVIHRRIMGIRGDRVMLDADLAQVYGVSTKRLNAQVKRNRDRFPPDFMFQLTKEEKKELVTNCDRFRTLKHSSAKRKSKDGREIQI